MMSESLMFLSFPILLFHGGGRLLTGGLGAYPSGATGSTVFN